MPCTYFGPRKPSLFNPSCVLVFQWSKLQLHMYKRIRNQHMLSTTFAFIVRSWSKSGYGVRFFNTAVGMLHFVELCGVQDAPLLCHLRSSSSSPFTCPCIIRILAVNCRSLLLNTTQINYRHRHEVSSSLQQIRERLYIKSGSSSTRLTDASTGQRWD